MYLSSSGKISHFNDLFVIFPRLICTSILQCYADPCFFFSYSIFWLQFSLPRLLLDPSHPSSSCPTVTWSHDDCDWKQCYDNLIFALSSKLEWATNYFTNNSTFRLKIHHYLEPPMSLYLHHTPPSMPRVSDVSVCFHNVSPALHHVTLQETAT